MTDEQIEAAARKLCEIRGIDPEKRIGHGAEPNADGMVPAVILYSPAWRLVAREVGAFYQVAQAIDHALGGERFP
jgi:hypothetical protein